MDKISVILPCYNVEKYLEKCIKSLLVQSHKNIEILIIDDGSNDNTLKIAQKYMLIDERIIVLKQKNKGVSSARNLGIDNSSGKYIVFIDPDDYVHEDFLKSLYCRIIETNSDMAICGHTKVYDNLPSLKSKSSLEVFKGDEMFKEYFKGESTFTVLMCDKIFKTHLIKEHNIYCPVDVTSGQDQVFILDYLIYCNSVSTIDNNYYYYYQRIGSKSKRYEHFIFERTILKLECLKDILKKNNIYKKFKSYFYIRLYMNLFSQGFLLYKYNLDDNFKDTFKELKKETLNYINKSKMQIFWDITFRSKLNIKEKCACYIIYFFPCSFILMLYKKYLNISERR